MTGDLARRANEKGLKVEWEGDRPNYHYRLRLASDGIWLKESLNGITWKVVAMPSNHEADCLVERAMREQMDGAWPQYSDAAIAEMMMDPDALLQAWEEVCCE